MFERASPIRGQLRAVACWLSGALFTMAWFLLIWAISTHRAFSPAWFLPSCLSSLACFLGTLIYFNSAELGMDRFDLIDFMTAVHGGKRIYLLVVVALFALPILVSLFALVLNTANDTISPGPTYSTMATILITLSGGLFISTSVH